MLLLLLLLHFALRRALVLPAWIGQLTKAICTSAHREVNSGGLPAVRNKCCRRICQGTYSALLALPCRLRCRAGWPSRTGAVPGA